MVFHKWDDIKHIEIKKIVWFINVYKNSITQ